MRRPLPQAWISPVLASLALAGPMSVAVIAPPHVTVLNATAALLGWGCWLAWLALSSEASLATRSAGLNALHGALAVLALSALSAPFRAGLPWSLALSSVGVLAAAALAAQLGASVRAAGNGAAAFGALCFGIVVAALANGVVGALQLYAPQLADGQWIAMTHIAGRAVGNMHQPNHLASLMVWGIVAAVWFGENSLSGRRFRTVIVAFFVFVVVLSASRTGALAVLLLTAWGVADRGLSRAARRLLIALPILYAASWSGMALWAELAGGIFGAQARLASGDIGVVSGRALVWAHSVELIALHPWAGVGWGQFNFAWTLTQFAERPQEYFGHPHNLVLALAAELGLPLALLVLGLLAWAVRVALSDARRTEAATPPRYALAMLATIFLHSLLEYPLWHLYFLLPAAFILGLCLTRSTRASAVSSAGAAQARGTRPLPLAALLLAISGPLVLIDFLPVAAIMAPRPVLASEPSVPLAGAAMAQAPSAERIAQARSSIFFGHMADGEAARWRQPAREALPLFERAPREFLDPALLQIWATGLHEAGDTERARYLAQRLKEFRVDSAAFFAACSEAPASLEPLPFQCTPPQRRFGFEDFRSAH